MEEYSKNKKNKKIDKSRVYSEDHSRIEAIEESHYSYNSEKKNEETKLEIIEEETKNYIEEMKRGTYNILVAVRARPLANKEAEFNNREIIKITDNKLVFLQDPFEYNGHNEIFKNRSRERTYAFDYAFDKHCDQHTVFNNTTKFLLDGIVNGFNATVFAYGATGAGKTYTMLGNEENPGIMLLTLQELFNKISSNSLVRDYNVKLWYIEIYNENIRDLLSNTDEYLDLREDPNKGLIVSGVNELNVTSANEVIQTLKKGNKNRTTEATNANETSSRSHAILQVLVEYKDKNSGTDAEIKQGKLSLIDLAGSERASATQNRGIRLIEGANINRSLLTLGNCINALCETNEKGHKVYVPYRDSKLTRILKDSLGGNARTVMIANISPSAACFEDTSNTLKYANRAKKIKTHIKRNVLSVQYHISNYNDIIKNLRNEINDLRAILAKKEGNNNNANPSTEYIKPRSSNQTIVDKCINELKFFFDEENNIRIKLLENSQKLYDLREKNNTDLIEEDKSFENIKNNIELDEEKLSEFIKKRETVYNSALNNLKDKDVYYDYLKTHYNNEKNKLELMENQYKYNTSIQVVNKYGKILKEFEKQIKIRDEVIEENNIKENAEANEDYLSLEELKKNFLPKIKNNNRNVLKIDATPYLLEKQKTQLKLPIIHNISSAKYPTHNKNLQNYYLNQYTSNNNNRSNSNNYNPRIRTNPSSNKLNKRNRIEPSSLDDKSILSNYGSRNDNSDINEEVNKSRDENRMIKISRQNIFKSKDGNYYNNASSPNHGSPSKRSNFPKIHNNGNSVFAGKDFTPFAKKKDLNAFYIEKSKNILKKPFK